MTINKSMKKVLKALSFDGIEVEAARQLANIKAIDPLKIFHRTIDYKVMNGDHEVPMRLYMPSEEISEDLPVFLLFHGGGWVTDSVDNYERICARLAVATEHLVISVEYRLAPEHKFPTGLMDCYAVAKALYTRQFILNVDPDKITLIGDSAGGNLAAAVALMARDNGEFQVYRQILIYPALYNTYTAASPYASVQKNGTDYLLTAVKMQAYLNLYESCPEDRVNPYFAPLLAKDFSNMPETLILTAEFDPLRDEGEDYGKKLAEAGNYVEVHRIKDALHGFFALGIRFFHVQESFSYMNEFLKREV